MYTGERILPGGKFNVTFQQSLFAYEFVKSLARGKTVLDAGSGEGYGSAYLAEVAQEVVGLDYHADAVRAAAGTYMRPNLSFREADLFSPASALKGKTFDIVCSFQTIEHFDDHDAFLEALAVLTRPGGRVIVTTPNTLMFPTFNPYHLHEVSATELRTVFERHFTAVELYGIFGSEKVLAYRQSKQRIGNVILKFDPFGLRERLPRSIVQKIYGGVSFGIKSLSYMQKKRVVEDTHLTDFSLQKEGLDTALDLLAIGTKRA